ncbi:RluA family pseudouridine synthase [Fusibacter tunisiensis]|jgi:23S rRNA pseudouridine955/2504/2580 synthase|uniref:Pseudouridine synthase n=1 Tax=Fusibacter tunisiensis TaxID=1008308 RepID=A0ABS2MRY7_9FIRM|nr:RluA family pseudouridine synthase [Fusibacter tunisiensis]MBM7562183.1 23S rRNA pseudouridine955/2504/2580 synthase [Fusibacter tunisiensis]
MKKIIISENEAEQRLDRFLTKYLNATTRSNIFKMIRKKVFKVNGVRVKEDYFLKLGDELEIFLADETLEGLIREEEIPRPDRLGLDIVYEDASLLILNKPKGMLTHPDKDEYKNTLATSVQFYLKALCTRTFRPAPIHRLDKNTSGLVVFAKTYEALKKYNELMRDRAIEKYYLCVVEGHIDQPGEVKGYLVKDPERNKVTLYKWDSDDSKFCHTKYKPIQHLSHHTVLEVELLTGRSHQIRASLAWIGHPIVGDVKYGGQKTNAINAQLLHSYRMVLEGVSYSAPSSEIDAFIKMNP